MRRYCSLLILFLFSLTGFAQLDGDGYYRVQNYGSTRWAYLRDNYGKIDMGSQQADCSAIQLWKNQALLDDPSSIVYIRKVADKAYDLEGQGTGLYKIIGHHVSVDDRSKYTKKNNTYWVYATSNGITKYLDDENSKSADKGACGFNNTGDFRLWSVFKINNTDNYLGVKPTVTVGNEHYAPYYVSFPFTRTSGMKVYYVSKVDAARGVAVMNEYTGNVVPASMPVFIKCVSGDAAGNKIMPVVSKDAAPAGNQLKGVYFNTPKRLNVTKDAATAYNAASMRVMGVTKNGKLGFINSTAGLEAYNNVYYLNANQAYLTVPAGTPDELALMTSAEYEEMTSYSKVTVTAGANGQVSISPVADRYKIGSNVTLTATPNTGYSFDSWSNGVKTNPYTFAVSTDVNITASFKVNQYTITFDTDGGSAVAAITQNYGSAITAPANPTKTGYTFAGWDQAVPTTMPAQNMTLKAKWNINQYTVTFNSNGGSAVSAITQNYGTAITKPANPTRTGYTFAGWDQEIPATMPAGNITITAKWTINQYTISFDTDGGSAVAAITQNYGSAITAPANPTKTGYTFAGWDQAVPTTMPAQNMTLKAKWNINQYTVTFNSNGGSAVSAITQNYGTAIIKPANPTRTGYTFAGWDQEIPATMPAGNITITAKWTINQYTITFNTDGGSDVEAITLNYGSAITAPESPVKVGYTFAGWNHTIPATMPAQNMTITALWKINKYTISFDTDGGSAVDAITQDYATVVNNPSVPTKSGYTFAGWDTEIPATMPASDLTIKALWTVNQYTIHFDSNGGSEVESITQDYNTTITAPANPTKTGYTFAGWDAEIPATMPASDLTIKAQWTVNQYMVVFVSDDDVISEQMLDYGSVIVAPANPEKEGYEFCGWDPTYVEGALVPLEGITYHATYKVNPYHITYMIDDVVYATEGYNFGEDIVPLEEPAKEGYTFSGWSQIPATMPAGDVTITGTFTVNKYLITFVDENGETLQSDSLAYGNEIIVPEAAEKEGYTFVGWTPLVTETVPASDLTYHAVYAVNYYTVTYMVNGEVVKTDSLAYGSEIPAYTYVPDDSERFIFNGWEGDHYDTMPAHDVVYSSDLIDSIEGVATADGVNVYNLHGVIVKRNVKMSELNSVLPRGIYIVNGKKMLVK